MGNHFCTRRIYCTFKSLSYTPSPKGQLSFYGLFNLSCKSFLFGLDLTLAVLLINSLLFAFTQRKIVWWKHIFNFSSYVLMIAITYYLYTLTGGTTGGIHINNSVPYLISFLVYFALNVIFIGTFFILAATESFESVFRELIKEAISLM